ncbi:hypothetical protein JW964_14745 [candidate division KSB1 bacterium]|nr:hypothetical protein [candidate division KSB1 bacterium]
MINQYKRMDVFRCNYQSHSKFENKVSVYHVLKKKNCWPAGCIAFKWKCLLQDKGKTCIKGYHYVGKNCQGCSYYQDIKINYQPIIILPAEEIVQFWEDLAEFEDWLLENKGKELNIYGEICSVKPLFRKNSSGSNETIRIGGYTLIFNTGYFGITPFEDFFYVNISQERQRQLQFAAGDVIEFSGRFEIDHGRLIFRNIRKIEFIEKGTATPLEWSDVLIAKETATLFKNQPTQCLNCRYGVLIDVFESGFQQKIERRQLYCLKGIPDVQLCTEYLFDNLKQLEKTTD